jgi:hypothetical protein
LPERHVEIYRLDECTLKGRPDAEVPMATGPDLRIGHAEREAAAASLREHYAQGRLTLDEFNERLDAVFKAATQRQLNLITRDLPHAAAPSSPLPVVGVAGGGRGRDGQDRQEWQGSQRRQRPGVGAFALMLAVLGTWLVLFDLHLRAFPWSGKLAIFVAIFALVRGVLRRVFGFGRRGRVGGSGRCGRGRARRYPRGPWGGL